MAKGLTKDEFAKLLGLTKGGLNQRLNGAQGKIWRKNNSIPAPDKYIEKGERNAKLYSNEYVAMVKKASMKAGQPAKTVKSKPATKKRTDKTQDMLADLEFNNSNNHQGIKNDIERLLAGDAIARLEKMARLQVLSEINTAVKDFEAAIEKIFHK